MAVIPRDKVGAAEAAGKICTRNAETAGSVGARREDHRLVQPTQIRQRDIDSVFNVADEPDPWIVHDLVQGADNAFDARMVGSHAVSDQPKRRRLSLEQVEGHIDARLYERVRDVDSGRPGSNDRDPDRFCHRRWRRCFVDGL